MRRVSSHVVFTTHTPVPAGHDRFGCRARRRAPRPGPRRARPVARGAPRARTRQPARLARGILHDGARAQVQPSRQRRVVAARSRLARDVDGLFPGVREEHIPIGHVTNGVHVNSWLAPQMRLVYERHLGADWLERSGDPGTVGSHRRHRRRRVVGGASDAQGAPGGRGRVGVSCCRPSVSVSRRAWWRSSDAC